MKKIILLVFLVLSLFSCFSYADIEGAPFLPEIDARFNALEQGNHLLTNSFPSGAADGHYVKQSVQATYDFAKYTGGTGTYDLGVSLPKNAIFVRSYVWSLTKPTTSASGTLEFKCQNSHDIMNPTAAASFASAGAAVDAIQSGAASNFSTVTASCDIKAVIATGALTAGKVTVYLDYVIHQ